MPQHVTDLQLDRLWNKHQRGVALPASTTDLQTDLGPEIRVLLVGALERRLRQPLPTNDRLWLRQA
ncbi:hypothetical protein IBL26_24790 [Roseomonas aerophila]|uniref:Uncharacterized protein n=1 Tax=Teichococcus aerophilus TaxID=1224513 RepID=A0ABR7RTS7_9PROT|nr:hypothetical protein [Pseudoroseomonas aerophila]MBC9210066.1 hypothetical protein [Pseudoroseomonas aerophila]